jgi:hypothetical protein
MPEFRVQDLMFALLSFGLALVSSFLAIPLFLPFRMEMFAV